MKKITLFILSGFFLISCSENNSEPVIEVPEDPGSNIRPISNNTLGIRINSDKATQGFTLFTIYKDTYLIDNCGRLINHWKSNFDRGGAFYLLDDGFLLRAGKIENPDLPYGGIGGIIEKFDWEGNLVWQYMYSSSMYSQHHGLISLPNGNIVIMVATRKSFQEAIDAGRNPEFLTENELYSEQLIEIEPIGSNGGRIVWQWDAWDHLVQDFDSAKGNYGNVSEHPELIDINFLGSSVGEKDWLHFNALDYNPTLDQIIMGSQKLSEIYIIDHSTTSIEAQGHFGGTSNKGGDLLFRWGNPQSYKKGTHIDQQFFGQHNPNWIKPGLIDSGKIIVFNNGLGRSTNYSSVDIIAPIFDFSTKSYEYNNTFSPSSAYYTYINGSDPTLFYSRILSSAQQLENGNIFICEGTKGKFTEITRTGEIVWEYINPVTTDGQVLNQGDSPTSNVFMAIKYPVNSTVFRGKKITVKDPIEGNFNIADCK